MPGIINRLKTEAGKASFEADRLRRLNQAQSTLKSLKRQAGTRTDAMGQQVLALFDGGGLVQPELMEACRQIDHLRQQIIAQEDGIQKIRIERPPAVAAAPVYGHICPRCQINLPEEAGFCSLCGSTAVDIAPPSPSASQGCQSCGGDLVDGALFCPICGARVEDPPPIPTRTCASCQTPLAEGAAFCSNCGAESTMPEEEESRSDWVEGEPAGTREDTTDQIACPECQFLIPAEAVYCPECGSTVVPAHDLSVGPVAVPPADTEALSDSTCTNCGAQVPPEAVWCPECGQSPASLPVEPTPPEPGPLSEDSAPGSEILVGALEGEELLAGNNVDEEITLEETVHIPVHIECPECHATVPAEAVFCPECGSGLASDSGLVSDSGDVEWEQP